MTTTIQGLNKARMLAIEAASIVSGAISGDNLILTKFSGATVNAGNVRGPQGIPGTPGVPGPSGLGAVELAGGVNLNSKVASGLYSQTEDADAASGTNYPVPYAGMLVSYANVALTQYYQTYIVSRNAGAYAGAIYVRVFDSSFTPWQLISPMAPVWNDLTLPDANVVQYDVAGTGYQTPQYKIDGSTVTLRGLAKTLTARTSNFTIADVSGFAPPETEIFMICCNITQTSSASSAASTGAASTGTAHTHTMPHTHTVANPMMRIDVPTSGLITTSGLSATNPLAINGFFSLSGISWDLV